MRRKQTRRGPSTGRITRATQKPVSESKKLTTRGGTVSVVAPVKNDTTKSTRLKRKLTSSTSTKDETRDKKLKQDVKQKKGEGESLQNTSEASDIDSYSDGEVSFSATPRKQTPLNTRSLRTRTPQTSQSERNTNLRNPDNANYKEKQNVKNQQSTNFKVNGTNEPKKDVNSCKTKSEINVKLTNGNGKNSDSKATIGTKDTKTKSKLGKELRIGNSTQKNIDSSRKNPSTKKESESESESEDELDDSDKDYEDESDTDETGTEDSETIELSEDDDDDDTSDIEDITKSEKEKNGKTNSGNERIKTTRTDSTTLHRKVAELESMLLKVQDKYTIKLKKKDEELQRLKNDLAWKEQQLEEMNELTTKNMELEAKISFIMSSKENYEKEVTRISEEEEKKVKKEKEEIEAAKKKKEDAEKKKQEQEEKEKQDAEEKRKETKTRSGKRKRRSCKKKEDESEGEDIDALFVSDTEENDIEVIGEKKSSKTSLATKTSETSVADGKNICNETDQKTTKDEMKNEDSENEDDEKHGRHNIRKVMGSKKLQEETIKAARTEKERRERAKKEHDKHQVIFETDSKTKVKKCKQLVLAFKEGTKDPLVEVNPKLVKKLKPHQVEGVEFMWDNIIESMDRLKSGEDGQGCILAHCMGLGKTLSVITLIHTLVKNKATNFKHCLVVCPLNTVLNWQYESKKWLEKKDRIHTYEMASCKHNQDRAKLLSEWHQKGGIMIMGYQLFRILANYSGRSKKNKKIFDETLLDPGPHMVICDEGHMLKNDASAISKAMNRLKTKRRIILTGTPLQNNLPEYHCMMSFVKPSLLGTMREFKNRFVNPINNGQHSDSTSTDVKVMKRRAHVLHQMLEGCVQRKDYTELTKLLPPKHEYVISIRLSPIQMTLYEKYLERNRLNSQNGPSFIGASLFSDYQALMRIWTHPYVLKLDEERQERKKAAEERKLALLDQDDELDSSMDEEEEEEIFISSDSEGNGTTATVISSTDENEDVDSGNEEAGSEKSDDKAEYKPKEKVRKKTNVNSEVRRSSRSLPVKINGSSAEDESDKGSDSKNSSIRGSGEISGKTTKKVAPHKFPSVALKVGKKSLQSKDANAKKNYSKDSKETSEIEEEGTCSSDEDKTDEDKQPQNSNPDRKAKVLAGEVIRKWGSTSRHGGTDNLDLNDLKRKEDAWWTKIVNVDEHMKALEVSGKLVFVFEVLRLAETLGDKVLVFSQSLLTLDLIETFLKYKNDEAEKEFESSKSKKGQKPHFWRKDEDYLRMDGSTGAHSRSRFMSDFNDIKNKRLRLFLISTKAGGLGINLDIANRVVIFDASWNPSHDIQSIFRVYRFGQVKPVYVYRLVAQGTMEEKIYERQVTKETLAQRVIDEHQIDRHFTASDLAELYKFNPDRLDDPNRPKQPTPAVPKDIVLAELLTSQKDWIVRYHEHDSLLENRPEQDLSEEERTAAWEEYEQEKQGIFSFGGLPVRSYPSMNRPGIYPPPTINLASGYNNQPFKPPTILASTSALQPNKLQYYGATAMPVSKLGSQTSGTSGSGATPMHVIPSNASNAFQVSQLPRVVQEIIKYNPTIGPEDLQRRLQAFLGMQNRYSGAANNAMIRSISQPSTSTAPAPSNMNHIFTAQRNLALEVVGNNGNFNIAVFNKIPNAAPTSKLLIKVTKNRPNPGNQESTTSETDTASLPSRLPLPGQVPATAKK